jgi:hypothetical protein
MYTIVNNTKLIAVQWYASGVTMWEELMLQKYECVAMLHYTYISYHVKFCYSWHNIATTVLQITK